MDIFGETADFLLICGSGKNPIERKGNSVSDLWNKKKAAGEQKGALDAQKRIPPR